MFQEKHATLVTAAAATTSHVTSHKNDDVDYVIKKKVQVIRKLGAASRIQFTVVVVDVLA